MVRALTDLDGVADYGATALRDHGDAIRDGSCARCYPLQRCTQFSVHAVLSRMGSPDLVANQRCLQHGLAAAARGEFLQISAHL
jgi:hypothetical protein